MINSLNNISRNKLTRQQLELRNRKSLRYPLPFAEKDYYLALAIQLIYNSQLRKKLIFKGGTAIFHCHLSQMRFSEDLDFTSLDPNITLEEIKTVLESDGMFRVNKSYQSRYTIKIERLQYEGLLGQPGNIKLEIDHHQNVVLPGISKVYQNEWNVHTTPIVMDQKEICAEKIRAVSQRARYRDFYDLFLLITKLKLDLKKSIELLRKKEIRKPIIAANIERNWLIAQEQIRSDMRNIFCKEKIPDHAIDALVKEIYFEDIQDGHFRCP
jgi:predicted nucleotidyltransferase component of viral defense system